MIDLSNHSYVDKSDGSLMIDFRDFFDDKDHLYKVMPWSRNLCVKKLTNAKWFEEEYSGDFPLASIAFEKNNVNQAIVEFTSNIPGWALTAASRFKTQQIPLLRLFSLESSSVVLAQTDPIIFWLLPLCVKDGESQLDIARYFLLSNDSIITNSLGMGDGDFVDFLKRVEGFSYCSNADILKLQLIYLRNNWRKLSGSCPIQWSALNYLDHLDGWYQHKILRSMLSVDDCLIVERVARKWLSVIQKKEAVNVEINNLINIKSSNRNVS